MPALTSMPILALLALAPATTPPRRLSETGLYVAGSLTVAPDNRPYAPQYPLWSDGADKVRWVHLPEGARIDVRKAEAWTFPVGTRFWKQFSFAGRKVETRLLWRSEGGWRYATYAWNAEQSEAVLAPEAGLPDHLEIAPGKRHSLPSVADCKACHENGRFEVLGFSALQLSTDRDPQAIHGEPLAPGMVTLETLVREDRLRPARPELLRDPPRIRARDPRERAALGYLSANCGSCHKPEGPQFSSGLYLKHSDAGASEPGLATSVNQPGRYAIPGLPAGRSKRLVPGDKAASSIHYRMGQRGGRVQMPPLATVLVDEAALARVGEWIEALPPGK